MSERGKIAKIELENQPDCTDTFMVFDRADDGGILVAIQTFFQCDLEDLQLLIEAGDFDAVLTLSSDAVPQAEFRFFSRELLKIQQVAINLFEKYDLVNLGSGDVPTVRLREAVA